VFPLSSCKPNVLHWGIRSGTLLCTCTCIWYDTPRDRGVWAPGSWGSAIQIYIMNSKETQTHMCKYILKKKYCQVISSSIDRRKTCTISPYSYPNPNGNISISMERNPTSPHTTSSELSGIYSTIFPPSTRTAARHAESGRFGEKEQRELWNA